MYVRLSESFKELALTDVRASRCAVSPCCRAQVEWSPYDGAVCGFCESPKRYLSWNFQTY